MTGQQRVSFETARVFRENGYKAEGWFYKDGFNIQGVIKSSIKLFKLNKDCRIIFVPSRSILGVIKELPIYLIFLFKRSNLIYVHIHGLDFKKLLKHKIYVALLKSIRNIHFILPSEVILKPILDNLHLSYSIVTNPVEIYKGQIDRSLSKNGIVYISNIISTKGQLEFLEYYEGNLTVRMCGKLLLKGRYRDEFHELLKKPNISYLGALTKDELVREYSADYLFVFLSNYPLEYAPLVLLNAMNSGLICVLRDTQVLRSMTKGYPYVVWMRELLDLNDCIDKAINMKNDFSRLQRLEHINLEAKFKLELIGAIK